MNITRHNYEEFFILYLDNELGSDDRRRVESFVNENPDLKNEFDLLLQTRMTPDHDLVFDGKQQLLKTALPGPISENNFEEWLLLYIDNELTAQEKIAVEEFVAGHPSAATTLQQLQKTKLHPEHAVVFPNKEILYRREKRAIVITLNWRKIAVAASLLLAISTAAFFVFTNNRNEVGIIAEQRDTNSTKNGAGVSSPANTVVTTPEKSESNEAITKNVEPGSRSFAADQENFDSENKKNIQHKLPSGTQEEKLIAKNNPVAEPTNDPPSNTLNPNVKDDLESDVTALTVKPSQDGLTINTEKKNTEVVTPETDESFSKEKNDSSEPIYAVADDGKKNKLRGFFRKVTRTFEKRTNIKATDDEDRLLLAGISIKL